MGEYNSLLGAFFSGKDGQGGYNAGFRQSRLAKLYQSQDPAEQEAAARQLAAVDPESAGKWQAQQAKVTQQRLEQKARMLASLPSLEQKQSLYASMLPDVRKSWAEAPDQYTPELDQALSAWAGGTSGKPKARSSHILADGTIAFMDEYGNLTKTGEKASNSFRPIVGANGEIIGFDPRSNVANPTGTGTPPPVPQTPPQGQTVEVPVGLVDSFRKEMGRDPTIAEINEMKAVILGKEGAGYHFTDMPNPAAAPQQPQQARVSVKPKDAPTGYQYNAAGTLEPIKGGPADPANKEKPAGLGDTNTLRDDYTKAIQQPVAVMNAYEKMRDAAQDPSPAGDIALIYAYMKILDPTSVVREGEFATAQNAGSVPDSVRNTWNKLVNGERLAINRGDFLLQGAKLYASSKQQYNQVRQQFKGIAERNGVNTADVLVDSHKPISQRYPAKQQQGGKYSVGQVLNINGKRYQVTGGDLNSDPDLKELP